MDNYGNDYFMSQEGYASIDFTLLDRPNSNIASAPESTAALLPDLHVADSSFPSFDFLDGPGVDAFGGVLREADEAQSREQGGYRSEVQKYKKDRSLLQNPMALHRRDGDPDSELPPSEFHIPFEVQKPISNLDFFSQGHTKESGHWDQQANSDARNEATDGHHNYFAQGQISQQTHTGTGGAGGWYNTWGGTNNQGDQTQVFFQTPSYDGAPDERRLMQMKGTTSQIAGQMGYHSLSSSQMPGSDPVPKAIHSFLPITKQSDSRQTANMGLGLPSAPVNAAPPSVVKSSPRNQAFDYEGLMNGSSANQFWQGSSGAVENAAGTRRHHASDADLNGQDALRSHAQSPKTQLGAGGAGGWYNTWGSNSQGDQTQGFFQTPSYDQGSDDRRLMQMKGNTSQLAGPIGYHSLSSSQVPSNDPVPKATHSFLPTAKQSDSRQVSNMGLGLPNAQVTVTPSAVTKNSSRSQPFEYESLMNGSSTNQFRQSSSAVVDNTATARRHQNSDVEVDGRDMLRSHAQSSKTHTGTGGAGGWYNAWGTSNSQADQPQGFLQTPSYDEASGERRLLQMKASNSQLAGQMGYHSLSSTQVSGNNPIPKATHSFLATNKQTDGRQVSNMGLGLTSAQVNASSSPVVKSSPRSQPFDYEGLMNGSSANQFRQSSSTAVENAGPSRRHQNTDADLGGQDALRHAQGNNYKYLGQNLWSLSPVEGSPLKLNDYDFLGGQYVLKGQTQEGIGQQLAVEGMQAWHQQPLLSQSHQQQASYQQAYQELSRQHEHQVDQQAQHSRQQQFQQFLAVNQQGQSLDHPLSAFLSESSLEDLPRVVQAEQTSQLPVNNPRTLLQTNYQPLNNIANLNWSATHPSTMQGLAHDYLMGADQNFNWQALALKASQVDPLYGSLPVSRRDTTGQALSAYTGMQGGLQEYFTGAAKLDPANAQAAKPISKGLGSSGSMFGGVEYQAEAYDSAANLQAGAQTSSHQALGKMPFWQNPYPQSVEHNRTITNLGPTNIPPRSPQVPSNSHLEHSRDRGGNNLSKTNLPPRSPQVSVNPQVRQQMNWGGLSSQQETLQGGLFSQSLANAETLKQSILAGSIQQNSQQVAINPRQSVRSQPIEPDKYVHQNSSQAPSSTRNVVDQLNLGPESYSGISEVMPAWSLGQNTPAKKDADQSDAGGESNRGVNQVVSNWSHGQNLHAHKDIEQLNLDGESSSGKKDALTTWSRGQNALPQKDVDQLNHTGNSNSGGTISSGKDLLSSKPEAEKLSQEEMSFLDGGTLRESNSIVSPAPSPDSNLFSSGVKQKSSGKVSSLSRDTLELLNKPEEPNESSSMNDDEEEEEELDPEDSGANASSISLAHLRRNQASGPLSPQGFGLRLAPPSHLSQNTQGGNSSRPVFSSSSLGADASDGTSIQAGILSRNVSSSLGADASYGASVQAGIPSRNASSSLGAEANHGAYVQAGVSSKNALSSIGADANHGVSVQAGIQGRNASSSLGVEASQGVSVQAGTPSRNASSSLGVEASQGASVQAGIPSRNASSGPGVEASQEASVQAGIPSRNSSSGPGVEASQGASVQAGIPSRNASSGLGVEASQGASVLAGISNINASSGIGVDASQGAIVQIGIPSRNASSSLGGDSTQGASVQAGIPSRNVSSSLGAEASKAASVQAGILSRNTSSSLGADVSQGASVQAGILSRNANTAARLQFLSQMAQRGQNPNGLTPWLSGLVGRSGSSAGMFTSKTAEGNSSSAALFSSRMAEGKDVNSLTASTSLASAVERSGLSGFVGRSGSNATSFTSIMPESKGPDSATANKSLAAAVERGFPGFVSRSGSNAALFTSRLADARGLDSATLIAESRPGSNAASFASRMSESKGTESASTSTSLAAAVERSGFVARSGSNASLLASRTAECKAAGSAAATLPVATAVERSGTDQVSGSRLFQNSLFAPPPTKKRKEYPTFIPWRDAISQSGGYVSSTSGSELEWATAANRIPDKDPYEEAVEVADSRAVILSRAKRRLRLTTHLMQQITPPVPAAFMQSKSSEDREGATYVLSKLALAEACRIASIARRIREVAAARDAEESRIERERELAMKEAEKSGEKLGTSLPLPTNISDRFKLRMKLLENDLQRLEASPSAVDLVREMQDTERIGLVNRLAVHHSNLHSLQNLDSPHRVVPQKYVTTVQMPNKLPEGLMCVSL